MMRWPGGDRLRNATPFPGILTDGERYDILKAWREGVV